LLEKINNQYPAFLSIFFIETYAGEVEGKSSKDLPNKTYSSTFLS
jgi:hypothetical protein